MDFHIPRDYDCQNALRKNKIPVKQPKSCDKTNLSSPNKKAHRRKHDQVQLEFRQNSFSGDSRQANRGRYSENATKLTSLSSNIMNS
jgi:hypothetical protein